MAALTVIWHYLARITDAKDSQTVLERILRTAAEEERAEIVNGYDLLMEQGELRYARRMLTNQLTQRFGALPPAVVSRLEVAELPALERWTYRVVQASSLAEVLDEA